MVSVRSVRMSTLTDGGSEARSFGSSAFTRSAVSMMFAPGWRWMSRMTAGLLSDPAGEPHVLDIVDHRRRHRRRRTGAPFL